MGDGWFDALGSSVPMRRRAAAEELMLDTFEYDWTSEETYDWITEIAKHIENDRPAKAQAVAFDKLPDRDRIVGYRILAVLVCPMEVRFVDKNHRMVKVP